MKKLLSLLGALSLSASASIAVVSCSTKSDELIENNVKKSAIPALMEQYSKALFISENGAGDNKTHVSSKYIYNNIIGSSKLQDLKLDELTQLENASGKDTFATISNRYVASDLTDGVTVSDKVYQDGTVTLETEIPDFINKVLEFGPLLFDGLNSPETIIGLIDGMDLESFLSEDLLTSLAPVLTAEALTTLKGAFSAGVYQGLTFTQSINSSIIGLTNAVDELVNQEEATKYSYATANDIKNNFNGAVDNLVGNIDGLTKGEKTISFDLAKNISAVAEVIRFVRTLLVYLNSYSFEEMTSSVLTVAKIRSHRSAAFSSTANDFDIKKFVKVLNVMVNDDKTGTVFKNFLGALLVSEKDVEVLELGFLGTSLKGINYDSSSEGGYAQIATKYVAKMAGFESIKTDILVYKNVDMYLSSLVRGLINQQFGQQQSILGIKVIDMVIEKLPEFSETLPEFLGTIIRKINENDGNMDKFKADWMGYLWNNDNALLDFKLIDYVDQPIKDLFSLFGLAEAAKPVKGFDVQTNSAMDFLGNRSLKDIVSDLNTKFESSKNNTVVKFSSFADLLELCAKDDSLANALKDPKNLIKNLGWDGQKIVAGSILEKLIDVLKENSWLSDFISLVKTYKTAYENQLKAIKTDIISQLAKTTVVTTENGTDNYTFTVSNGTVTVKYTIQLSEVNNKKVIQSISI